MQGIRPCGVSVFQNFTKYNYWNAIIHPCNDGEKFGVMESMVNSSMPNSTPLVQHVAPAVQKLKIAP